MVIRPIRPRDPRAERRELARGAKYCALCGHPLSVAPTTWWDGCGPVHLICLVAAQGQN